MPPRIRWTVPLLILLAGATPAVAQQRVAETRPAPRDGTVKISSPAGSVTIIGWDVDSVRVSGTLGDGVESLQFSTNERETRIRVVVSRDAQVTGSVLEVRVPHASHVAVRTQGADIRLDEVWGASDLESVSGNIEVLGHARALYAQTATGDVVIEAETKILRAKSVDGTVTVARARGYLEVSTVTGDAHVTGGSLWEGQVTTVSGAIRFRGDFDPGGGFYFETHSGDIDLELPAVLQADFDLVLLGGRVDNEFAAADERTFSTGGGGTQIRIKTFRGNVHLRKR